MAQRIIIGYVDSPGGRNALTLGQVLADLDPETELTVTSVYVCNPPVDAAALGDWQDALRDQADSELGPVREALGDRPRTTVEPCCGVSPAEGLHRLADDEDAGTIVVGVSRNEGAGRVLAGSATEQTLHGAPCAVGVAPEGYEARPLRTVVASYNGSDESKRALRVAADIARAAGAALRIVAVVEPNGVWYAAYMGPQEVEALREHVREELRAAHAEVGEGLDVSLKLVSGTPVEAITKQAADADLLVLGSRGHGPLRRVLLGSVSSRLVREPPCPVLVLPRRADEVPAPGADG